MGIEAAKPWTVDVSDDHRDTQLSQAGKGPERERDSLLRQACCPPCGPVPSPPGYRHKHTHTHKSMVNAVGNFFKAYITSGEHNALFLRYNQEALSPPLSSVRVSDTCQQRRAHRYRENRGRCLGVFSTEGAGISLPTPVRSIQQDGTIQISFLQCFSLESFTV